MAVTHNADFSIVAVGASAGNEAALREFFSEIPVYIPACFVVILHESSGQSSQMPDAISQFTPLNVVPVTEGRSLQRGTVYVMPENVTMQVRDRILHLHTRDTTKQNCTIDTFFSTVARDFGAVNLAVILSGMGSDGTEGALDMYRNGGHVLVQDPASAQYKGMPESVIQNDHPEMVGPPRELGIAVLHMVNDIYASGEEAAQ